MLNPQDNINVDLPPELHNHMQTLSPARDLHTCLYADDLASIGRLLLITQCIRHIKQWSLQNEININLGKSALLQIRTDGRTRTVHEEIEDIPVIKEIKYLGIHLDHAFTFKKDC